MEETVTVETKTVTPVEPDELTKLWNEYLQQCCVVGQLGHQLEQLDGQRRELEKHKEVAERAVKSAASKHRELKAKEIAAQQPVMN